jgi:AcrR family transcriptional regulator
VTELGIAEAVKTRRTQQERSEEARARLLSSAIDLICEHGFARTTLADVATRAGFTRGAIQHHFVGRDELALAIIHSVENQVRASFDALLPDPGLAVAARADFLVDTLGLISRERAHLAVVDIWMATRSNPHLADEVRNSMLRSSSSYKKLWLRTFEGEVAPTVIADCRRVVVTLMRGMVINQVLISNNRPILQMLATAKEMVRRHLLAALA